MTNYEIAVTIIKTAMEYNKDLSLAIENDGEWIADKVCNDLAENTTPDRVWEIFGNLKRHLGLA